MPTVSVNRADLFDAINQGEPLDDDTFEHLCFEFGIELDDVICEIPIPAGKKGMPSKGDLLATGPDGRTITTKLDSATAPGQIVEVELLVGFCNRGQNLDITFGKAKWRVTDPTVIYKIDVPANRSDLLCHEGLVLSLRVFRGIMPTPAFGGVPTPRASMLKMSVAPQTGLIRPHVVCAVLRGVSLDQAKFDSFIKLQEKLHFNIARRRSLVAIGTHDLDKISAPFTYEALPPTDIKFVPLKQEREFTAAELMELYLDTTQMAGKQLREYVPLIYDSPVYPVIYDAERTVLSLPPVINGSVSAVSVATRNIFIECTAVDRTKADVVLSTLVCLFSQYCDVPFSVEQVEVTYEASGKVEVTPNLASWQSEASLDYINTLVGERLSSQTVCSLLERMQLSAAYDGSRGQVVVQVPPTRSDILHACDIAEDVAIAYGYNNIRIQLPKVAVAGEPQPLNLLTELLRIEIAALGFSEVLTLGLCSHNENFANFRTPEVDGTRAVVLDNPKTREFEVVRTSLLPGLMKTLRENKAMGHLRIFEVSDVVLRDEANDIGAKNTRNVAVAIHATSGAFEVAHGVADRLMQLLEIAPTEGYHAFDTARAVAEPREGVPRYSVTPSTAPKFFPGFGAAIEITFPDGSKETVGHFGILHPEVLGAFALNMPVTVLEMGLGNFVDRKRAAPSK